MCPMPPAGCPAPASCTCRQAQSGARRGWRRHTDHCDHRLRTRPARSIEKSPNAMNKPCFPGRPPLPEFVLAEPQTTPFAPVFPDLLQGGKGPSAPGLDGRRERTVRAVLRRHGRRASPLPEVSPAGRGEVHVPDALPAPTRGYDLVGALRRPASSTVAEMSITAGTGRSRGSNGITPATSASATKVF